MFAALLALALSQAAAAPTPPVRIALVISRRSGITVGRGIEVGEAVAQALGRDGIALALTPSASASALGKVGVLDSASCAGKSACVSRLAGPLKARVVIGLDLAQVVDQLALHLVAVPAGKDVALADGAFVVDSVAPDALVGQLEPFARQLRTALLALPPESTPPQDANLLPPMESPLQVALHQPPPSHLSRYLAGGAAVGFTVASAGFLAVGLHQKGRLTRSEQRLSAGAVTSSLTQAQARSLRDVANRDLSLSLVSGAVAAGLAGLTAYLWEDR